MISRDLLYLRIFVVATIIYAVVAVDPSVIRTTPKPDVNRIYLKPGDRLDLTYECSDESELRFNADRILGEGTPGFRSYWDNKVYRVKLSITVKIEDSGQYICELKTKKARDTLDILVVNITGKNDVLSDEYEPVSISCSVGNLNGYSMEWYKQGTKLTAGIVEKGESLYNITSDGTLTVNSATRKEIGQYDCVVFPDPDEYPERNITGSAFVESTPYINHFERSKNLVQGDTVKIICQVYAYPPATVTWFRLMDDDVEKPITGTENRTIISAANGVPNSKLEISDLVIEDGGTFGCRAKNSFNSTSATILVRVKDKYAALWPFLGIVVEVVVLCVIIFIYEKKRGKRHEEDDAPDVQKTNSHDHKADDLRQRNKNVKA